MVVARDVCMQVGRSEGKRAGVLKTLRVSYYKRTTPVRFSAVDFTDLTIEASPL